jgi:putative transcriptional regulator
MKKTSRTSKHDWKRFDAMTDEQRRRAAESDPAAIPLAPADFKRMKRTPRAKIIRRALGLTQEEFASRFRIPLGTLRDWEQGASEPDQAARAYLTVIARNPKAVADALLS